MTGKCPFCGEEYEVEDSCYGRMAECPSCHRKFIVGQASAEAKPEGGSSMRRDANKSTNLVINGLIPPKVARIVFWIGSVIAICCMFGLMRRGISPIWSILSILGCCLTIVALHKACGKPLAAAGAKQEGDTSMQRDANKSTNLVIDEFITPKVARIVFWILTVTAICGMLFCITSGLNFLLSILGCALMIVGLRVSYELIVVVFAIEKNTRCGKEQCKALDDLKDAMMKLSERLA